ncbi:MAG: Trigger factor [Parcubacteria group bacterium GW2011_GWA2_43_13]|nr:MAG: Trigger factor [Parcubacteria group bacterium GW2011_GWA2_43_13]OGY70737.1 MAG: trigger factor [Candidatus Jacksonbacteria bacterium RIFCSPLOWO2_01_FULL_44_13]HAZ16668.1 trigger factor [Candidatus Jacksonbacteria bacterium]
MQIERKNLEKSHEVELSIELSPQEVRPYLEEAARHLSEKSPVKGFRPGLVSFDIMRKRFGDSVIVEHALESIVSKTVFDAIKKEGIETMGPPRIDIKQAGDADKPLVYSASVALVPTVTPVAYDKVSVKKKDIKVEDQEIDAVIQHIRESRTQEALVLREARVGDKVEVDFFLEIGGVPIEDGQGKKHPFVIGKKQVVPEFDEQVIGMIAGEEKSFDVRFPADYFKKELQGKQARARLILQSVYELVAPEVTDEFVSRISRDVKTVSEFRFMISKNLESEKQHDEDQRCEEQLLSALVKKSEYSPISPSLIEAEAHRMVHEMQDSIQSRGLKWEDYLAHIKKTEDEMIKDADPQAEQRFKAGLLIRAVALKEEIVADDAEIEQEISRMMEQYGSLGEEAKQKINSKAHREHVKMILRNRKAIEFLKDKIIT